MAYFDFKSSEGSGAKAYYLGELAHGATMNVASKYADYANLTADNFVIVPKTGSVSKVGSNSVWVDEAGWTLSINDTNTAAYSAPTINYNAQNGNLSFSSTVSCGGNSYNYGPNGWSGNFVSPSAVAGLTAKVYLLPKIENL